jgi:mRNA interferase MazF
LVVNSYFPNRGDIVKLEFGNTQQFTVLVISPIKYNRMASLVLVCPITSNQKGLSFEVPLVEGMQTKGVVLADQIKTLNWRARKVKFVESVAQDLIEEVQAKLETLIL